MGLGGISIWQLLIILVIVFVIFGTKRLRNLGGDLGSAIRGFKEGLNEDQPKEEGEPTEQLKDQTQSQTTEHTATEVEPKKEP